MAHFGPQALEADLLRFVPGEMDRQLAGGTLDHAGLHAVLVALINRSLHQGVAADPRFAALGGRNAEARSLANLETSLFLLRGIASKASGEVSAIRWPSRTAAGDWLRGRGAISGRNELLARVSFDGQTLEDLRLDGMDLDGARFETCRITRCFFDYCMMASVTFRACDISDSQFVGGDLSRAAFVDTRLGYRPERSRLFGIALTGGKVSGEQEDPLGIWNLVGDRVYFEGGATLQRSQFGVPWQPPVSVLLGGYLDRVTFTNCALVGVRIEAVHSRNLRALPFPATIAMERTNLVFCDVPAGGPLAEAARRPVAPVALSLFLFTGFALPDEIGAAPHPRDGIKPLSPGEGGAEGAL
jgi:uncharacterized protein YjbI with pentapeptide repeats